MPEENVVLLKKLWKAIMKNCKNFSTKSLCNLIIYLAKNYKKKTTIKQLIKKFKQILKTEKINV